MATNDAHQLQIANRALEATVDEQRRTIMQLEDRINREEAENRRLGHLVADKNAELEDLKQVIHTQKRKNVELMEELQRQLSATAASPSAADEPKEKIDRWVQTLVDITPPEEVDRMQQQIDDLKLQVEQYENELADFGGTLIRPSGMAEDNDSNRGDSPDPEVDGSPNNDSFVASNTRKPPRLQLNFAIPPNLGTVDNDNVVLTARGNAPSETPRAHIRIPGTLLTSRGGGNTNGSTNIGTARDGSATGRRHYNVCDTPRVQQTPRVSGADIMRRSYVDPTTTSAIMGDVYYANEGGSQSPRSMRAMSVVGGGGGDTPRARVDSVYKPHGTAMGTNTDSFAEEEQEFPRNSSPRASNVPPLAPRGGAAASANGSPVIATSNNTSTSAAVADKTAEPEAPPVTTRKTARSVMGVPQQQVKSHGTSRSPDDTLLSLNNTIAGNAEDGQTQMVASSTRTTTVTTTTASAKHTPLSATTGSGSGDIAIGGGHMFSIEDAEAGCPVCSLMEQIQNMYTGKRVCKEAYYAVGWIPEMCHRWSLEHNIAWTIEERAAVATALTNRTKLSAFTTSTYRGPVNIWRKRPFWRSAWRPAYAVLQGVFLYIFNSSSPNEPVVAVIPVRASFIELVTLNGRNRCLQISSLGCMSCVGASAGDCVETMTISLDTDRELLKWEKALQVMQRTCAHKCSQKFMNELNSIRDIAEMLLTLAKETDKKLDAKDRELAAV